MKVSTRQLQTFQKIIDSYLPYTQFPVKGHWKQLNNNQLWLRHVGQVMVVGGAVSKDRFERSDALQGQISFDNLSAEGSELKRLQLINSVLRAAGVRYAGRVVEKCAKSKALLHNHSFIAAFDGGFAGLMQHLDKLGRKERELSRVAFLMQHLKFMKHKSARDFLMGLGMNQSTLALDIRIQNIFGHVGIAFPTASELGKASIYNETEKAIIEAICNPLKIEPLAFDRILFQHYAKILRYDYLLPKLFT